MSFDQWAETAISDFKVRAADVRAQSGLCGRVRVDGA